MIPVFEMTKAPKSKEAPVGPVVHLAGRDCILRRLAWMAGDKHSATKVSQEVTCIECAPTAVAPTEGS